MSHVKTTLRCPSCEAPVRTPLSAGDAGDEDAATDDLRGRDVECARCESSFEVLFYPR